MEFNFGLGAVAAATSPGIVPEMETTDQPNGECDLCYIAAGSHVDVGNDENDRALTEEYARSQSANHSSHFPTQTSFSN